MKNYNLKEIKDLISLPLNELIFKAQKVHKKYFKKNDIQLASLISIKTGSCPEDCKYCSQSIKYNTDVEIEKLLSVEDVIDQAKAAKDSGASRFCMGAAWRNLNDSNLEKIKEMVKAVKKLNLETCLTLGMLKKEQADSLKECGLDYYNHNLDSSEEYYSKVVSTRTYQDRLNTLSYVRDAGIKVCTGGILGLGEENIDRLKLIEVLCNMEEQPESVPMNKLVKIEGTPYSENESVDNFDFIRVIAISRITMPKTFVRLSAGRDSMNDEMQALCFFAGANSIFYGDELLTTKNSSINHDKVLMDKLSIKTL